MDHLQQRLAALIEKLDIPPARKKTLIIETSRGLDDALLFEVGAIVVDAVVRTAQNLDKALDRAGAAVDNAAAAVEREFEQIRQEAEEQERRREQEELGRLEAVRKHLNGL